LLYLFGSKSPRFDVLERYNILTVTVSKYCVQKLSSSNASNLNEFGTSPGKTPMEIKDVGVDTKIKY
jgi:hypothetical protein